MEIKSQKIFKIDWINQPFRFLWSTLYENWKYWLDTVTDYWPSPIGGRSPSPCFSTMAQRHWSSWKTWCAGDFAKFGNLEGAFATFSVLFHSFTVISEHGVTRPWVAVQMNWSNVLTISIRFRRLRTCTSCWDRGHAKLDTNQWSFFNFSHSNTVWLCLRFLDETTTKLYDYFYQMMWIKLLKVVFNSP